MLEAVVTRNSGTTSRELSEKSNVTHTTLLRQLKKIGKVSVVGNKKEIILYHDNASLHTAQLTQNFLEKIGYEKLLYPIFSPDLALSDYSLFTRLENHLDGPKLTSREEIEYK